MQEERQPKIVKRVKKHQSQQLVLIHQENQKNSKKPREKPKDQKNNSLSKTMKNVLQDKYLNVLINKQIAVSIYLKSGVNIQGRIAAYDQYMILLKNDITQTMYKYAIVSILPRDVQQQS